MNTLTKRLKFVISLLELSNACLHFCQENPYKSFVCPHLDYGDILYDNPVYESLVNLIEKVQYKACLAITGAIQGTSHESLYQELGLESLRFRRWYRKMIFFYRIVNELAPKYLTDTIPTTNNIPFDVIFIYFCGDYFVMFVCKM